MDCSALTSVIRCSSLCGADTLLKVKDTLFCTYDFTTDFLPPSLIPHLVPQRAGSDLNKLTNHILKVNKQVLCLEVRLGGSRLVIRNACNAWSAWQLPTVERGPGAEWALGRTALY